VPAEGSDGRNLRPNERTAMPLARPEFISSGEKKRLCAGVTARSDGTQRRTKKGSRVERVSALVIHVDRPSILLSRIQSSTAGPSASEEEEKKVGVLCSNPTCVMRPTAACATAEVSRQRDVTEISL
jgi:hypothetical protein